MYVWGSRPVEAEVEQVGTVDGALEVRGVVPVEGSDRQLLPVSDVSHGRLGVEGSVKSGTTIAEGSSHKENDVQPALKTRPVDFEGREPMGDELNGDFIRKLPILEHGGGRKDGRRPLGSLSPPMPCSPLVVVDDGSTGDQPNQTAGEDHDTGDRTGDGRFPGPPVPDKDRTPRRSNTIGKSNKVDGRAGKRSIRDKFGLASALRGKSLGKSYRGRITPSSTVNEKVTGSSGSVPFPSSDSTLHASHRPPPLAPSSTSNRYPSQMSLVVPDVPTPMCAWPTPKMGEEVVEEVDGRLSLSSSGTVKGAPKGRAEEVSISRVVDTAVEISC